MGTHMLCLCPHNVERKEMSDEAQKTKFATKVNVTSRSQNEKQCASDFGGLQRKINAVPGQMESDHACSFANESG
jgi:hypothetical protein